MIRLIRTGAVAAALLAVTTACGVKAEPGESERPTIVTVWTKDRHDAAFQEAKIDEYNRANQDNIKVEYKIYSDNYYQVVNTAFQNHNGPDLMAYTSQLYDEYQRKNYFADISPYMDDEFRDTFGSLMMEGVNLIGGKCYYIPTGATGVRLFYNKTLFERAGIEKPPETMEELVADAERITRQFSGEGIYGFASNMKNPKSALDRSVTKQGVREQGVKAGFDFGQGRYAFEKYTDLITQWRELMSDRCAYPNCEELDIDPLRQLFSEGKIGMYMSYTHSEEGVYKKQFPMEEEWDCVKLPTTAGRAVGRQNYSLNSAYLFNAASPHMDEAWKVYRAIFTNQEYLEEYYMNGLGISVVPAVIEEARQNGYKPKGTAALVQEDERLWPSAPQEANPGAVAVKGLDMYDTMKNLIFGTEDIREGLRDLSLRYNEAYQKGIGDNIGSEFRIDGFDPMNP